MRFLRVLPLLLATVSPLAAQLTPEQRAERETRDLHLNYNRHLNEMLEQRAIAGDPTAYGGPAACGGGREASPGYCAARYYFAPWRSPAAAATHWMSIADLPRAPRQLRRAGDGTFRAKSSASNVVTLASPIGAKGKPLMIRAVIDGNPDAPTWSSMREVTGDDQERYLVPLPTLATGEYQVTIEVYDPDVPLAPYSKSTSTLKLK